MTDSSMNRGDQQQELVTATWNRGIFWCHEDKLGADPHRDWVVARFLENQISYFDRLQQDEDLVLGLLGAYFGENWRTHLLTALGTHFYRSPVHDLVSVQPFEGGPVHVAQFYGPPEIMVTEGGVTECNVRLLGQEIRANVRRLGAMHQSRSGLEAMREQLGDDELGRSCADTYAKTMWEEITRSYCVADLLVAASTNTVEKSSSVTLYSEIQRQSTEIHRQTLRGPGNRILVNPRHRLEADVDSGKHKVITDPLLSPHEVLVAHKGAHQFVTGYIFSPYVFTFSVIPVDQFERQLGSAIRGASLLVDDRYYRKIKIAQ